MMPGMQGPELAQRLIALQPNLHVLLISGFVKRPPAMFGLDDRDVAFLAKPFRLQELVTKLQELVARSSRATANPTADQDAAADRTVLVVDDDEVTVDLYARILRAERFHVIAATTAE